MKSLLHGLATTLLASGCATTWISAGPDCTTSGSSSTSTNYGITYYEPAMLLVISCRDGAKVADIKLVPDFDRPRSICWTGDARPDVALADGWRLERFGQVEASSREMLVELASVLNSSARSHTTSTDTRAVLAQTNGAKPGVYSLRYDYDPKDKNHLLGRRWYATLISPADLGECRSAPPTPSP